MEAALRDLCCEFGWCYGVFWRSGHSGLLALGGTYYGEPLGKLISDMLHQVHRVGEGSVGNAAASGRHQWITADAFCNEESLATVVGKSHTLQGDASSNLQFSAGIKTIAIIPLQPLGVFEFGSSQKILENFAFVNKVRSTMHERDILPKPNSGFSEQMGESLDSGGLLTTAMSYGDPFYENVSMSSSNFGNMSLGKENPMSPLKSSHAGFASHRDSFSMDVLSPMVHSSFSYGQDSSLLPKNHQASNTADPIFLPAIVGSHQDLLHTSSHLTSNSNNEILSLMEQQLLKMIGSQDPQSSLQPNVLHDGMDHQYHGKAGTSLHDSTQSHGSGLCSFPSCQDTSGFQPNCNAELTSISGRHAEIPITCPVNLNNMGSNRRKNYLDASTSLLPDNKFGGIELDLRNCSQGQNYWDDIMMPEKLNCSISSASALVSIPEDVGALYITDKHHLSDSGLEELIRAANSGDVKPTSSRSSAGNVNSVVTHIYTSDSYQSNTLNIGNVPTTSYGLPCFGSSTPMLPKYNLGNIVQASSSDTHLKSQVSSWIEDCYSMNTTNALRAHGKKPEEHAKVAKKRARPGESTRPRPKDRQLIQDRVKELRELVPNGSKCSIDALLDRTIKHMIYLQNVTKYADKIKQTDESKMIGEESGVVLRDNSSGSGGGCTTWAFEVAGQTMVCPIVVEDLSPPSQMLIEMLCEEHGYFLEIADIIRGFGLAILKGVMEVRKTKIWAQFVVEANRAVTRMEVFLALVQLLQQTTGNVSSTSQTTKHDLDSDCPRSENYNHPPLPIPISLPDRLH